jgi:hypothetical protein
MKRWGVAIAVVMAGCNGGGDDGPPADGETWTGEDLAGACPQETRVGGFIVESGGNAAAVAGSVADAVLPISVRTEVAAAGGCRILRRENPFCDPPCAGNETCGLDGTCVLYPRNQQLGTVRLAGTSPAMEMMADTTRYYSNTSAQEPLFSEGALIQLDAEGGDLAAFRLRGVGVEDLVLASMDILVRPGMDLVIPYTASGRTDVDVYLSMNVDQHGSSPGAVVCVQEDTGMVTVPASIVDGLLALGQSGVPNAYMSRRTTDSVNVGPGCAELVVSETVPPNELIVRVEGVYYCTPPQMCPMGMTCNLQTFICE